MIPNITYRGKISHFGGPNDKGVSPKEGLALFNPGDEIIRSDLFLPEQPEGTTGLARRLNPEALYCACRWNYNETPKPVLRQSYVKIMANGRSVIAKPCDWGPAAYTDRIIDASPGVMKALGIKTDDVVEVCLFVPIEA